MIKFELKRDDVVLIHEALEIADVWHLHSKRFLKMRKHFKEVLDHYRNAVDR